MDMFDPLAELRELMQDDCAAALELGLTGPEVARLLRALADELEREADTPTSIVGCGES